MARDPFVNYDAWLEKPYQDMYAYSDKCERVIEELGLSEEEAEDFDFDAHFADEEQAYWEGRAQEAAEAKAEAELDWEDDRY